MKNVLDLKTKSLQTLDKQELMGVDGGFGVLAAIAVGLAIAAGAEIFGDWDNFKNGLSGQREQYLKKH